MGQRTFRGTGGCSTPLYITMSIKSPVWWIVSLHCLPDLPVNQLTLFRGRIISVPSTPLHPCVIPWQNSSEGKIIFTSPTEEDHRFAPKSSKRRKGLSARSIGSYHCTANRRHPFLMPSSLSIGIENIWRIRPGRVHPLRRERRCYSSSVLICSLCIASFECYACCER